jgi:hypothetical protein
MNSFKFLLDQPTTWCGTYDIGRGAAAQFKNPSKWLGQTLDVVSYQGDLSQVAKALETVGGVHVSHGLAMPMCLRGIFLGQDLHQMCNYFEANSGVPRAQERIAAFKEAVPNALSAEDWFRFHNRYDGTEIVRQWNYSAYDCFFGFIGIHWYLCCLKNHYIRRQALLPNVRVMGPQQQTVERLWILRSLLLIHTQRRGHDL